MNYYLLCPIRGNPCLTFQNYFFFLLFTKSNVIQEATSHSGAHEFTPGFYGSRDVYYLVLFRFTTFDYPFHSCMINCKCYTYQFKKATQNRKQN
jgi:hypothetical protein